MQQDAVVGAEHAVVISDDGRHALKRDDQRVVALQLNLQASDDLVVLIHFAVLIVQLREQVDRLLAGISHVEGVLCRLRIEHQAYLLAFVHVVHQPLMLRRALLLIHRHELLLLLVAHL